MGSRGMWELGTMGRSAGQGQSRRLRHEKLGKGLRGVGGEGIKTPHDSCPVGHLTLLSPVAWGCPWVKALPKAEIQVGADQSGPTSLQSQLRLRRAWGGKEPQKPFSHFPAGPSDPLLLWLWPSQRCCWAGGSLPVRSRTTFRKL